MPEKPSVDKKINVRFSHLGLVVSDIEMMEDFYTRVIGFERTDGGMTGQGVIMTFMTLDPSEHHQVFLVEGKPDEELPSNKIIPNGPPVLHHLSSQWLDLSFPRLVRSLIHHCILFLCLPRVPRRRSCCEYI